MTVTMTCSFLLVLMSRDEINGGGTLRNGFGSTFRARQQEIDYENEQKRNMVSGQDIWLGLGPALRVAGMGSDCGFYNFAWRGGPALATRQAFWPLDCVRHHPGGGHDYYLPGERGETALALGKGLTCGLRSGAGGF
jgi:hypothetical protein